MPLPQLVATHRERNVEHRRLETERVYDGKLLFHGPAFQMIRGIGGISEQGITAELSGIQAAGGIDAT